VILETRKSNVNTNRGSFGLYVSCHSDGTYFASVLWYNKSGDPASGQDILFDHKMFVNESEDAVTQEAEEWINANLDSNASIEAV
jgi:hypothetical protein